VAFPPEYLTDDEVAALRSDGFAPHQDIVLSKDTAEQYYAGPFKRTMVVADHLSCAEWYAAEAAQYEQKAAAQKVERCAESYRGHAATHRELEAKHRAWVARLTNGVAPDPTLSIEARAPTTAPTVTTSRSAPVLVPTMRRARKDPIARLIAAASAAGVRFRISGATLVVDGTAALHPDDQALLRAYVPDIRARLEPPEPTVDLLELLDVEVEVVTDAERARAILGALGDGACGFDIETAPQVGNGSRPWIKVTKSGYRAVHQDKDTDKAGLDPLRARPRLASLFVPAVRTVYVFDLMRVPVELLKALEDHAVYIHNAPFDVMMLAAQGVHLRNTFCTLQMARLALGAERGGLRLSEVAAAFLDGIEIPKDAQVSDWSAERLSARQIRYAAADAVVAYRIARPIWDTLDAGARRAFKVGTAIVVPVAAMRLLGIPFDGEIHTATIARWEHAYVEASARFVELTGEQVPPAGVQRSKWLEARMPADMLSWWPRVENDLLRTRSADLERLAAVPEIRPLLDVIHWDKRLRAFGRKLLDRISTDGRLRMDFKPAATKTGRCSCSNPNLQQLPRDVRNSVVAKPGRLLVVADYNQIELRIAAELSGDEGMRQVFRDNVDMHRLNAAAFAGIAPEDVSDALRNTAKRIGFGTLYGSGARGLVASAWSMYRIEISEAEAQTYKNAFYARYPRLRQWQNETAEAARSTGVVRSVLGRPLRVEWENGELRWTTTCNFPVQSSAADVMLVAMAKVADALPGALILQVHDELVLEVPEDEAEQAAAVLDAWMVAAFAELFPGAPLAGLVKVAICKSWSEAK
jgi:DNA polymerase I